MMHIERIQLFIIRTFNKLLKEEPIYKQIKDFDENSTTGIKLSDENLTQF